jgi:nucleotide-binding universal stress UspA family protein
VSYRTILVHLNDSRRARQLLRHAAEIARTFEARLIGLHVSPTFHGRVVDPDYPHIPTLEGLKFSRDEEADHLRAIFNEVTDSERFCGAFRSITAERTAPAQIVLARARAADLVIASQADCEWPLSKLLDCSDRLAIESGRPVLIVPNANDRPALPKTAIVAWNQTGEATRAMFEALPLLKGARTVELLILQELGTDGRGNIETEQATLPASAIAEALAAHGITLTVTTLTAPGISAGEQICARASEQHADLIVMGAYGHSRLREFVFGGATRHVLANMTVPTLFSH